MYYTPEDEEGFETERIYQKQFYPQGLSNAPTTLAVLGIALSKSLGISPFIGGIAGAVLGGVIIVIADQTTSPFIKH